jgi:hypothetical protein
LLGAYDRGDTMEVNINREEVSSNLKKKKKKKKNNK